MTFAKYPVTGGGSGSGDVTGPGSSVNNGLVLWNGTGGTSIKDAGVGAANQVLITDGTTPSWSGTPTVTGITLSDYNTGFKFNDGTANTATIALSGVSGGAQTLTIPTLTAANAGSVFIIDRGSQSFKDLMFFQQGAAVTTSLYLSATLGGNEYTITPVAPSANRVYSLPDAGGSASFVLTAGNATIGGIKTFSSGVVINPTTNQLVLGTTNTVTITSPAPAASRVYTIPDAGGAASFVMDAGTNTIAGTLTLPATVNYTSAGSIVKSGAGDLTLTNASAAGLTFAGTGTVTAPTGTYTLAGLSLSNVFTVAQTISATSNQIVLHSGVNQLTLNSSTSAAARVYSFPDVGTTGTVAMLEGAQTFSALKTFSSGLNVSGGSAANGSIWFASNVLRQRGGTSGWAVDNTSGTAIISATDAGAVTVGSSAVTATTGPANVIFGAINSGSTGTTDNVKRLILNANSFVTGETARIARDRVSGTLGGAALQILARGTDTLNAFIFQTNLTSDSNTTDATNIGTATQAGAWTWGPASFSGTHTVNGNMTVGVSNSSNGTLRVQSNAATASSTTPVVVSQYTVDTDCTGGYFFESRNTTGATIGRIEAASNTTVAYQTSSDSRLKQNPTPFEGLCKVLQMLPKEYEWKSNPGRRDKGFYAQELFEVYPEAVSVGSDELTESGDIKKPWAIDYGRLTPVLVRAIQELHAKLQALKAS